MSFLGICKHLAFYFTYCQIFVPIYSTNFPQDNNRPPLPSQFLEIDGIDSQMWGKNVPFLYLSFFESEIWSPSSYHQEGWILLVAPAKGCNSPFWNTIVMDPIAAMMYVSTNYQLRIQQLEKLMKKADMSFSSTPNKSMLLQWISKNTKSNQ